MGDYVRGVQSRWVWGGVCVCVGVGVGWGWGRGMSDVRMAQGVRCG